MQLLVLLLVFIVNHLDSHLFRILSQATSLSKMPGVVSLSLCNPYYLFPGVIFALYRSCTHERL